MTTLAKMLAVAEDLSPELPAPIAKAVEIKAAVDSVQNIGGFPICDPLLLEDRIKAAKAHRAKAIATFNGDKQLIKAELLAMGIDKFIAIVPTEYWKKVCDRHQLITVEPTMYGHIRVSNKKAYDLTEAAQRRWEGASVIICAGTLFGSATAYGLLLLNGLLRVEHLIVLPVAGIFAGISWALHKIGERRGINAVRRYLETTSQYELLRELLNDAAEYHTRSTAQLILPDPPLDVVLLLRKLRDATRSFKVTAEPAAIQFNPSVEQLYLKGHAAEKERLRELATDPIITITHGSATAVLAQFGDFQWEKEIIEEIVATIPLPVAHD